MDKDLTMAISKFLVGAMDRDKGREVKRALSISKWDSNHKCLTLKKILIGLESILNFDQNQSFGISPKK